MGILDDYKAQLEEDRKHEDNEFPEGSHLSETQREEYEKRLHELRHNVNDIENKYKAKKAEMRKMDEEEMIRIGLVVGHEPQKIMTRHAFCEECGEELISDAPPMFNPFTMEKICKHTCKKCGKVYNLEYAYPRIVIIDNNGEEIPAFTR